ncbi:MAG: hypothetical protein JXO22_04705, partial [Phycisphaerae bacterium]|nr:hypothetical protein [Phycisphaerae bacterium]
MELAVQALVLACLLAVFFPGVFLRGEVLIPGDILFQIPPWSHYAPAGWQRPANPLLSDALTAFIPYYAECADALRQGEWPLWNPTQMA